jgi:hypothetical protein
MKSVIMSQNGANCSAATSLKNSIRFVDAVCIYGILSIFVLRQLSYKVDKQVSSFDAGNSPEEELINTPSMSFSVNTTRNANETDTEAKHGCISDTRIFPEELIVVVDKRLEVSSSSLTQPEPVSGNAIMEQLKFQTSFDVVHEKANQRIDGQQGQSIGRMRRRTSTK